jgi:hypothetical protein
VAAVLRQGVVKEDAGQASDGQTAPLTRRRFQGVGHVRVLSAQTDHLGRVRVLICVQPLRADALRPASTARTSTLCGIEILIQLPAQHEEGAEVGFTGEAFQQDAYASVVAFPDRRHDLFDHLP